MQVLGVKGQFLGKKIRVLVADDHPVMRRGLLGCLTEAGLQVVGEAGDGNEAVQKALGLGPDVILMDISMPGLDGLAATKILRREASHIKVLVLSVHGSRESILRMIRAGAHGYISKQASATELLRAIECVHRGEAYFSLEIAEAALRRWLEKGGGAEGLESLTQREREVLVLIAEGQSNKQMATRLGIEVRTVEAHRQRIMDRLKIHSVAGLTRFAIANGLISLE